MRTPTALALSSIALLAAGAGAATAQMNVLTPTTIDGTTTGKTAGAYRGVFGGSRTDRLEGNITRLVFNGKQTEIYMSPKGRGTAIVSGRSTLRTASGVGPCSTYAELQAAFPTITRISGMGGMGWKSGRLWFRVEDGTPTPDLTKATVTAVMLVASPAPAMARTFLGNTGVACH